MKSEAEGKRIRVYVAESDQHHGQPLFSAILQRCRELGLAGATVVRGVESFGAHGRVHTARIFRLAEDLPIVIDIIDTDEQIQKLLPALDEMIVEGLVTVESVHLRRYSRE